MNYRLQARSGNCRGDKRTVNGDDSIYRRFDGCRLRPLAANSLSGILGDGPSHNDGYRLNERLT
jgi:hypothetical protein